MKNIKKLLIIALLIIAAAVFVLQVHAHTWALISLYWFILTIKNAIDVLEKEEN